MSKNFIKVLLVSLFITLLFTPIPVCGYGLGPPISCEFYPLILTQFWTLSLVFLNLVTFKFEAFADILAQAPFITNFVAVLLITFIVTGLYSLSIQKYLFGFIKNTLVRKVLIFSVWWIITALFVSLIVYVGKTRGCLPLDYSG